MRRRPEAILALVVAAATLALAAIGAASLVVNQPMKMAGARTRAPSRGADGVSDTNAPSHRASTLR